MRVSLAAAIVSMALLCAAMTGPARASTDDASRWTSSDALTPEQAGDRFRRFFRGLPGQRAVDAPFRGWYILETPDGGASLFNADISLIGLGRVWHRRIGDRLAPLTGRETSDLLGQLRQSLREDAVVPAWHNASARKTGPMNVLFTAPNCPTCLKLDATLIDAGEALRARLVLVPGILGNQAESYRFYAAVMCSADAAGVLRQAFAARGRGSYSTPAGCAKGNWLAVMMSTFYQEGNMSVPALFRANGTRAPQQTLSTGRELIGVLGK